MTGGNPAKKGMRIMTQNVAAQKRTVSTSAKKEGLSVQDLILVAVLIAAGAVLKLTVSSFLSFAGMKPNFMIAMYCLAIILTRPKVYQSVVIGLLVGLVSQLPMLNATPLVNIASEMLGALACGLLVTALAKVAADNRGFQDIVAPVIITFLSTIVSGYTFAMIVGVAVAHLEPLAVFGVYAVMVLGTATMNAVLAAIPEAVTRADTPQQAAAALQTALPALQSAADNALHRAHSAQPAHLRLERFAFAARDYGGFALPGGEYTALRIELGGAQGRNWFCVLYPALCLSGAQSDYPTKAENTLVFGRYEVRWAVKDAVMQIINKK